jgi:hypothetical protein
VISFINGFAKAAAEDKYVLSNELGDGRVLSAAPKLERQNDSYSLFCPVVLSFPRIDAQILGSDMAEHPDILDVYADAAGKIARVSGLDYLPQKIQTSLSLQRGESIFHRSAGIRFYEY